MSLWRSAVDAPRVEPKRVAKNAQNGVKDANSGVQNGVIARHLALAFEELDTVAEWILNMNAFHVVERHLLLERHLGGA